MIREHLVIRREDCVARTRERPEVGIFTQTHSTRARVYSTQMPTLIPGLLAVFDFGTEYERSTLNMIRKRLFLQVVSV